MNVISPIDPLLTDEHVLAVDPLDGAQAIRKHLNAFQGRALSAQALSELQISRMAHQSLLHRSLTPGIVNGLEIAWRPKQLPKPDVLEQPDFLVLSPGFGLTASGEDICIGTTQQFKLADLAVLVPQVGRGQAIVQQFPALITNQDALATRTAILLAVPISHRSNDKLPPPQNIFVPRDPVDDPFAGAVETDGCLFALYPLSLASLTDAANPLDPQKNSFRNDLSRLIFAKEQRRANGNHHPWEEEGLPLALVGFNTDWTIGFVDRSSVVRNGGRKVTRSVIPGTGNPALWQARIEQFGEQLGGLDRLPEKMADLQQTFPTLPPVGFMPKRLDIPRKLHASCIARAR
jgi:hypothetical protein